MTSRRMHLIMGAVSLWTRPPTLYLCTGPLKIPINPTAPRRAARSTGSQRFLNSSSCEISTVSLTTAPGKQLNLHNRDIDHPARTATAKSLWSANRPDHGNRPLRHDREVNLLDQHNRGIDNLKCAATGPLQHERDVNDLEKPSFGPYRP